MIPNSRCMMWANYRRGPKLAVPAPVDDKSSPYWWYDRIASLAHSWALTGQTDVLFPNPVKTQSGSYRTGDGYGPTGDYDIGSKNHMFGGFPTRFGTAEQLRRAIAICRANGIDVHIDHVMHQIMGQAGGNYTYLGADGKTAGRFPKHPSCFRGAPPRVPEDPVPSPPDDFAFGDELCPVNAIPKDYVWDGLLEQGDWLFRTLGVQGARLDDMKGINAGFITAFMKHGAMNGKFFFGEYASGNRNDTEWWVNLVERIPSAADFDLHYNAIMPMCNNPGGNFHMSWLANRGMMAIDPLKSVTFVESMDSDTNGFATVVNNKELGYAFLLTCEGFPQIYIRDYLREPECYGLQHPIDNLCWIHACLAHGKTAVRYSDQQLYIYERTSYPNLLVALSNDVWNPQWHTINVQTGFGANVEIHDYSGHNDTNYWTDNNGRVTIGIPPGANGKGYGCWSRVGMDQAIKPPSYSTTQTFFGADDLDIPGANNNIVNAGRIWVKAGSPILSTMIAGRVGWTVQSLIQWQIMDPNGVNLGGGSLGLTGASLSTESRAIITGWHTIMVTSSIMPVDGSWFEVTVTYTAPKIFSLPAAVI